MKDKLPVEIDDVCEDYSDASEYQEYLESKNKELAKQAIDVIKDKLLDHNNDLSSLYNQPIPLDNGLPQIHIHEADFDVDDDTVLASVIRTVENAIAEGHDVKGLAMCSATLQKIAEEGQMDIDGAGGLPNLLATDTFSLPITVQEKIPYTMVGLLCKKD